MQVDEMFDYLSGRIGTPPPYWYNHEECPWTVTGGYTKISIPYSEFTSLRSVQDWADPFTAHNKIEDGEKWSTWDSTLQDGLDAHEDYIDIE
tara:strand:- start:4613 stop:4888 length:276 start_codon:yes stop_codon:yes gene_type:complete